MHIAQALGIFTGVYLFSVFFYFIIKQIFKKESFGLACICVAGSMLFYEFIPIFVLQEVYGDENFYLGFVGAPLSSILICYLLTTKYSLKKWMISLGLLLVAYILCCFPLFFILNVAGIGVPVWLTDFILFILLCVTLARKRLFKKYK